MCDGGEVMMRGRRNATEGRRRFLTGEVSKRDGKVLVMGITFVSVFIKC